MSQLSNSGQLSKIEKLYQSGQKIFSVQDLSILWEIDNKKQLWSLIRYYLRRGTFFKLYKGIYALDKDWTQFEFAQKLVAPSYISFHSALAYHGLVFQYDSRIHSAATLSKTVETQWGTMVYHQLKDEVFFNQLGLEVYQKNKQQAAGQGFTQQTQTNVMIAGPERAVCDSLYLYPKQAFDSYAELEPQLLKKIANLYHNRRLLSDIQSIIKNMNHA
jgi:predicted transcriptional regulator of viral defense system